MDGHTCMLRVPLQFHGGYRTPKMFPAEVESTRVRI